MYTQVHGYNYRQISGNKPFVQPGVYMHDIRPFWWLRKLDAPGCIFSTRREPRDGCSDPKAFKSFREPSGEDICPSVRFDRQKPYGRFLFHFHLQIPDSCGLLVGRVRDP